MLTRMRDFGIKRLLHRDLVSHPATHAWVLNLYRAGERHPEFVEDYFPIAHAPWSELAQDLTRHKGDEQRHARMYTGAIVRLGEPVCEMEGQDVFNEVIRSFTPGSFRIRDDDDDATKRDKLAQFLAHAHFLEKRIQTSLRLHLEACEWAKRHAVAAVVAKVLEDEDRHVRYTREGVAALATRGRTATILETHRRAEAKANLAFSEIHMRYHLRAHPSLVKPGRRLLYSLCATLMNEAISHV
jgi:hypothetical protein